MWEIAALMVGNQWARLIVSVIAAYMFGFYSVSQPDIPAIVKNAEEARDAEWKLKLADVQRQSEAAVAVALETARAEPAVPADRAQRLLECRKSPTCRDRSRQ